MKSIVIKILMICIFIFQQSYVKAETSNARQFGDAENVPDTLAQKKVVIKFLKWYKINIQKANSFHILIKDKAGNFKISKTACNNYLNFLTSSKCLSPKYIACWRKFFDDQAINLQKNHIKSDIPEGFDIDFVLITQEPELVLYHIGQTIFKTEIVSDTDAVVGLSWPVEDGMQYNMEMHKNKEGWQIDYIATPNFD